MAADDFDLKAALERLWPLLPAEGQLMPDADFFHVLDMPDPRLSNLPYEEANKLRTKMLARQERLFDYLLEWHSIWLKRVPGERALLHVRPQDQAEMAEHIGVQQARTKIAKAQKRAQYVRTDDLSDAQRQELTDRRARLSRYAAGMKMRERRW